LRRARTPSRTRLSAQPQRVFRDAGGHEAVRRGQGDLYVYPLHNQPLLDGYREDWGISPRTPKSAAEQTDMRRGCWRVHRALPVLYLEVDDPQFDPNPATRIRNGTASIGSISRWNGPTVPWSRISSRPARLGSSKRKAWSKATTALTTQRWNREFRHFGCRRRAAITWKRESLEPGGLTALDRSDRRRRRRQGRFHGRRLGPRAADVLGDPRIERLARNLHRSGNTGHCHRHQCAETRASRVL
jgi:hypothetical protein